MSFCCFRSAREHRTTQCPALTKQLLATLINSGEAMPPSILRRSRKYPSNLYQGQSPPKSNSTLTTQRSVNASNMDHSLELRHHPPHAYVAKCVCDTAKLQNLEAKNTRTSTVTPSHRPPDVVVSHMMLRGLSSTPHTQKRRVALTATNF